MDHSPGIKVMYPEDKTILHSFRFGLILGQWCGLLPLEGVTTHNLSFKWASWRVIHTVAIMLLLAICIAMCCVRSLAGSFSFDHLATIMFFLVGLVTLMLYLQLARNFPKFLNDWSEIDRTMNRTYGYPRDLDLRLKVTTGIALSLVLGEYIFGIAFHAVRSGISPDTDSPSFLYFKTTFPAIFYTTSSYEMVGVLVSVMTWLCAFIWTYNDLFIVLISTALALRFKQITDCLQQNERKSKSSEYWIIVRRNYDSLSVLCKSLDSNISFIVLISFGGNTFFILVQLFYSFKTFEDTLDKVYFVYAFSHQIVRLVAVSLYGAWINDESKEPVNVLNSLPSTTYNVEIQRLLMQISFDSVALTGNKMFKVTRGLILSVTSAVVTYELVLIQFNSAATEE